jgi:predicted transcriptional regulator
MGRRRGEVQIIMDILDISLKGVKLTHIMYKANLSYSSLRKYLLAALNQGLICKTNDGDGSVVYRATEKGKSLLKELRCVKDYLSL